MKRANQQFNTSKQISTVENKDINTECSALEFELEHQEIHLSAANFTVLNHELEQIIRHLEEIESFYSKQHYTNNRDTSENHLSKGTEKSNLPMRLAQLKKLAITTKDEVLEELRNVRSTERTFDKAHQQGLLQGFFRKPLRSSNSHSGAQLIQVVDQIKSGFNEIQNTLQSHQNYGEHQSSISLTI